MSRFRSDESGFVLYADSIILPSDQIAEWIRPRQSEADPGVRALVRADSSMLMAKDFLAQHAVEVQLVYAPASRKLHVVLVEGDSLYYFIDPGAGRRRIISGGAGSDAARHPRW